MPQEAARLLGAMATPPPQLLELGLKDPTSFNAKQLSILSMVKFVAQGHARGDIAKGTKIMENLNDVLFVLRWIHNVRDDLQMTS